MLGALLAVAVATAAAPSASAFLLAPASGLFARLTDAPAHPGQSAGGPTVGGGAEAARLGQAAVPAALLTPYEVVGS